MEWEKLEDTLRRSYYPVAISGDVPNPLNRWLIKSAQGPLLSPFDEPLVDLGGKILPTWQYDQMSDEVKETNWRFHISEMVDRYQEANRVHTWFTSQSDTYMYACTGVYCSKETDVVVHVLPYFSSPIRIWINGKLALCGPTSSIFNSTHFMVRLHEGFNAVLVECPLFHPFPLTHNEFIVHLHPVQHLLTVGKDLFLDTEFLSYLKQSYCLVPDRNVVQPGEQVKVLIQPMSFLGDPATKHHPLIVVALDSTGTMVEVEAFSEEIVTLQIPAHQPIGTLRLYVRSADSDKPLGRLHLACGEIEEITKMVLERLSARADFNPEVQRSIQFAAEIPHLLRKANQYFHRACREDTLSTLFEAERYTRSDPRDRPVKLYEVYPRMYPYVQTKTTSSGITACHIVLPDNYDPKRLYPVVFFFHDPQARHIPVHLPWTSWASISEAITVAIPGIGRQNDADVMETIRTIRGILAHLNVDRERVYGIGFCYGSTRLFQVAMAVPHLFAAMAPIIGDPRLDSEKPEYELLENIQHTAVYGISSVQNWFYNSIRMRYALSRMPKSQSYMVHGFMHNEVNDFLNSRLLLRRLLEHRLVLYPKSVRFTVINPAYNKAHWVEEISLYDRQHKIAFIEAAWNEKGQLRIQTNNVRSVTLLVGQREIGCEDRIHLSVNGYEQDIELAAEYASMTLMLTAVGQPAHIQAEAMDKPQVYARLTAIAEDTDKLGFRKVYASDPLIVRPSPTDDPRRAFHRRLSYLLQHPIRDRYIHYDYRTSYDDPKLPARHEAGAFLHVIDLRRISDTQQDVLRKLSLTIDDVQMKLDEQSYSGDFALITIRRWNQQDIGIVAYNSDLAGEALLTLWHSFESNTLLCENTVIWHAGQWITSNP